MNKKWWLLAMSAVCALSLAACGNPDNGGTDQPGPGPGPGPDIIVDDKVPATSISLNKSSLDLEVGKTEKLTATVAPDNTTDSVEWRSSDASVATVSDGTVTALKVGTAVITVTAGEKSAKCSVTVTEAPAPDVPATGISLDKSELALEYGGTSALVATVTPENSTDTVKWSTSDGNVATVSGGTVTAVGVGTATITATAGEFSATCAVTVNSDINIEEGYIWSESFKDRDVVPGYLSINAANSGAATITEDGLHVTTGAESGRKLFVEHTFDEVIDGTMRVQMRVKSGNVSPFNDILFFLTETGENVMTVAIQDGKYYNNIGSGANNGWNAMDDFAVEANVWQDVELIFNTQKNTFDLYVSDGEHTAAILNQSLRIPANKGSIKRFRFGGDMNNIDLTLDYIKISYVSGPELTVTQPAEDFELDLNEGENEYKLIYSATSTAQGDIDYAVTCDKSSGYTVGDDKETITFSAMGTYTFTVTATDKYGSASKTIAVKVKGEIVEPSITMVSEENVTLSLQATGGAKYKFEYTVAGSPVPTDSVEYDGTLAYYADSSDDTIKSGTTVTLLSAGSYVFTVEANNGVTETAVKTVTITVTDTYAVPENIAADRVIFTNSFDSAEEIAQKVKVCEDVSNGEGSVSYDGGKMRFTTTANNNNRNLIYDMPFGQDLVGITSVETQFAINSDSIYFTNLMFFVPEDAGVSATATANFAIDGNKLKVRSGSSWDDIKFMNYSVGVQNGAVYTLRSVLDMNNKVAHLYLKGDAINLVDSSNKNAIVAPYELGSGEIYLGSYAFRVPTASIGMYRVGSRYQNIDFWVDNIKAYQLSPTLTVNEKSKLIQNFTGSETYTFDYTAEAGADVQITCDKAGATVNNGVASFTEEGVYTFTISASNAAGSTKDQVKVTVVAQEVSTVKTYLDVDFRTNGVEAAQEAIKQNMIMPTGSGAYEFNENGLHMYTGASSGGTLYYRYDMGETLTGVVTTEIGFMIPASNNHMVNLMFWFADMNKTNEQPTNYALEHDETIRSNTGGGWSTAMSYNGKKISLIEGEEYTFKAVHDFDNERDYVYLSGNKVNLDGAETTINGGIYLGSFAFRNKGKTARVLRTGIDNKSNADYTLTHIKVYKSNAPVFVNETTEKSVPLSGGTATLSAADIAATYTLLGGGTTSFTCSDVNATVTESGVTFNAAGTYTVTVTATNDVGSTTHNIKVTVSDT